MTEQMPTRDNPVIHRTSAGSYLLFIDGDREILVFSSKSGREIITVDGKEVINQIVWKMKSIQRFTVGQDQYEVELNVESLLKGRVKVSLIKNDVHLKSYLLNVHGNKKQMMKSFATAFVAGMISGYAAFHLVTALVG